MNKRFGSYGYIPDPVDSRDHQFSLHPKAMDPTPLPDTVNMMGGMPPVYDQGQMNSCVANAVCAACQYNETDDGFNVVPSRLFMYYYARYLDNLLPEDEGSSIRTSMRVAAAYGTPPESAWQYTQSNQAVKPPEEVEALARKNVALEYVRVATAIIEEMRRCLFSFKPFVVGIMLHSSFESDDVANTGEVPMPGSNEPELGPHAMLVVGYAPP